MTLCKCVRIIKCCTLTHDETALHHLSRLILGQLSDAPFHTGPKPTNTNIWLLSSAGKDAIGFILWSNDSAVVTGIYWLSLQSAVMKTWHLGSRFSNVMLWHAWASEKRACLIPNVTETLKQISTHSGCSLMTYICCFLLFCFQTHSWHQTWHTRREKNRKTNYYWHWEMSQLPIFLRFTHASKTCI